MIGAARVALLLALGAAPVAALEPPELIELDAPDRIQYRVQRDLDGDGTTDLMVLDGRRAHVWHGRADGWRAEADAVRVLPEGTVLFDVLDLPGETQRLVARTADGYFVVRADAAPERLPVPAGAGLPTRPANLLWRAFRFGLGDGRGEAWIDVAADGYRIAHPDGHVTHLAPRLLETARTSARDQTGRWIARTALARWVAGRFDADARVDLAFVGAEGLTVHRGDEEGHIAPHPDEPVALPDLAGAETRFTDFDGDGRTDVLAVRHAEGIATVLLADPERGLRAPRRTVLRVSGEIHRAVVADLDGDGRPDLALPYLARPSVQDAVRVVLRGEVMVKAPAFLNRAGKEGPGTVFRARADTSLALPVRIRVRTDSAGRVLLGGLVVVEAGGDLDGDGRPDLVVTRDPDRLAFHRGAGAGDALYEKTPSATLPIPDCSAYESVSTGAADLNGDGRSDIILHYRGAADRPDRLLVLASRRP